MDDDNAKMAATVNKSNENVTPGAVHIRGINARSNHQRPNCLDDHNAIPETASMNTIQEEDGNNNPLIRKLRGEVPRDLGVVCARQTQTFSRSICPDDRNAIIETASTNTIEEEDNNNPLIRKLRGEVPSDWGTSCAHRAQNFSQHNQGAPTTYAIPPSRLKSGDVVPRTVTPSSTDFTKNIPQTNSIMCDDLESGGIDTNTTDCDIAVALQVDEEDACTPTAVEYDSDAKKLSNRMTHRFGLRIFLLLCTVVIGFVGAIIGITMAMTNAKPMKISFPSNQTNKYRNHIAQFVSSNQLDDVTNPYWKALDWISNVDPMLTTPDNPRFIQRYVLAYFYFATSTNQPWVSDCAPSNDNDKNRCAHELKKYESGVFSRPSFKWLSNTSECDWAGLQCDLFFQVNTIELGGIGMSGTFPDGIVYLPNLQTLSLMHGELEGSLPQFLGNLKNLFSINLRYNKFTGTIPTEWYHSRSLKNIYIESNRIGGTISPSILNLLDLIDLRVGNNVLSGTIPNAIGDLSSLNSLSLQGNNFDGSIPRSLGNLQYFSHFDASSTSINGTIPKEIGNMKSLTDFFVAGNQLTGKIPENFWKATLLSYIDMADNFLTGTISGKITTLISLEKLFIANNQFIGALPPRMGQTDVNTIQASGNMFNGTIAPQLCDLVEKGQLEVLVLDCAAPKNSTPEIICPTGCCTICCTPDGKTCYPN